MFMEILRSAPKPLNGIIKMSNFKYPHYFVKRNVLSIRRAKRIINEDELFGVEDISKPKLVSQPKSRKNARPEREKSIKKNENNEDCKSDEIRISQKYKNLPMFTKLYRNEPILGSLMLNLASKKRRKKDEKVVLEGARVIKQALYANFELDMLIFSRIEDIHNLPISSSKAKLYKVPYRTIQLWSKLTTSPGMIAIFQTPTFMKKPSFHSLPLTIICDNVRDPGNLGSILRAAAGVGCEQLILTKGCAGVWESKVIRSSAGAHFHIPIQVNKTWDEIEQCISRSSHIYVAENNTNRDLGFDVEDSVAYDHGEKLGGISNPHEVKQQLYTRTTTTDVDKPETERLVGRINLPVVPYYSVDYTKSEVVLVVGGETVGLSKKCFQLVEKKKGTRVNVPLDNDIDSLNAGVALGVIAFEVKRQFLMSIKNVPNKD